MNPIELMIAEDHAFGRAAYVEFMKNNFNEIVVTGEAGNGHELMDLVRKRPPHVILLDIEMPVMNGRDTLAELVKEHPAVKVLIFTNYKGSYLSQQYIKEGAHGFLHKNCDAEELLEAILTVHREGYFTVNRTQTKDEAAKHQPELSVREREILIELCKEKQVKEIAKSFDLSDHTVEFHKRNLYHKTNSRSIAGLTRFAYEQGLLI